MQRKIISFFQGGKNELFWFGCCYMCQLGQTKKVKYNFKYRCCSIIFTKHFYFRPWMIIKTFWRPRSIKTILLTISFKHFEFSTMHLNHQTLDDLSHVTWLMSHMTHVSVQNLFKSLLKIKMKVWPQITLGQYSISTLDYCSLNQTYLVISVIKKLTISIQSWIRLLFLQNERNSSFSKRLWNWNTTSREKRFRKLTISRLFWETLELWNHVEFF